MAATDRRPLRALEALECAGKRVLMRCDFNVPLKDGSTEDLSVFTDAPVSGGFTTTLMDQNREQAFFAAYSPSSRLLFGYAWNSSDFPWLGRWEENYSRTQPPWNGKTLALGMEFGVSPMPETRRQMVERAKPAPDLFLAMLERIDLEPRECLVIEDAEKGMQAAIAAGLPVVVVRTRETREFDFSPADLVLDSHAELLEMMRETFPR